MAHTKIEDFREARAVECRQCHEYVEFSGYPPSILVCPYCGKRTLDPRLVGVFVPRLYVSPT